VTMRRLNRYEVSAIKRLSGIENVVSEKCDFIFYSALNFVSEEISEQEGCG